MKRILLLLIAATVMAACSTDEKNALPGIYLKNGLIETYPTDTLHLTGTISNYVGLGSLTFSCQEWEYEKTYDLSGQNPVVFNYEHTLIVPDAATFDVPVLEIIATDINGLQSVKNVPVKYLVDQVAPSISPAIPQQFAVDYNLEAGKGIWEADFTIYDRRGLKSVVIDIPGIGYSETFTFSETDRLTFDDKRMICSFKKSIEFVKQDDYQVTVTAYDLVGNKLEANAQAIVMVPEVEDPVSSWPGLYLVNASENPDDYVDGYYKYMDVCYDADGASIPYTYQTTFYAPIDNMPIYLVPSKSMDADIIGVSPRVSSKLLNKSGYAVPIQVPGPSGYYGLYVDMIAHTYEFWEVDPEASSTKCTENVWVSGTGFNEFSDWGALESPMVRDGYRYTQEGLSVKAGFVAYYFYTANWARVFRASDDSHYWFESADGTCAKPSTEYEGEVVLTFDSVLPYGTIKKK